jgi:hypothetical protein
MQRSLIGYNSLHNALVVYVQDITNQLKCIMLIKILKPLVNAFSMTTIHNIVFQHPGFNILINIIHFNWFVISCLVVIIVLWLFATGEGGFNRKSTDHETLF